MAVGMVAPMLDPIGIPQLGLGTWELAGTQCSRLVEAALEMGYRHIDTAEMYDNEADVGLGLRAGAVARSDIFLTTKVWLTHLHAAKFVTSAEASLKKLRTDYVDLLLIHWPAAETPLEETIEAMLELRERGLARHLGVSNFPTRLWQRAQSLSGGLMACNQVEFHVMLDQSKLLRYARANRLVVTAYSPLAKGKFANHHVLKKIGAKYGKSASQVALRWLVEHAEVAAVPRSSSPERCRENLEIFNFSLSPADKKAIAGLPKDQRQVTPHWAPVWD